MRKISLNTHTGMAITALSVLFFHFMTRLHAQPGPGYWQQSVSYRIEIDFNVKNHRYSGVQELSYHNQSPDTLTRLFYHLYLNAFQPGSAMDIRSRTIMDPDRRVAERIMKLKPDEIGYTKVLSFTHNGEAPSYFKIKGTILEVGLNTPILPGQKASLRMEFESQTPLQIRRNGRNNTEGIDYSMAQWYPKICAYDRHGWHPDEYIGREFYGTFGNFDVTISIDSKYTVAATGILQNPETIGKGYAEGASVQNNKGDKTKWQFKAERVNDFVWAADPDYKHVTFTRADGTVLRFFYQPGEPTEAWEKLPGIMDRAFDYINARFGKYPYPEYAFIQGGDGGMEYPMATLITGNRPLNSLVGVSVHELMHIWYPMVISTNEARFAWMDEGFVNYATGDVMNFLAGENLLPGRKKTALPQQNDYQGYINLATGDWEEALSTPSDHFQTNTGYGVGSYSKGSVFLSQLSYVIGSEALNAGLLRYFDLWQFKHPDDKDFIRIMEKVSGVELDWYLDYFVYSTHTIDYRILEAAGDGRRQTAITLERSGAMPMPVDVEVLMKDGSLKRYHIPLDMMQGPKHIDSGWGIFEVAEAWTWVAQKYTLEIPVRFSEVSKITIDPSGRMADTLRVNNEYVPKK
jgi:hypothetical protein